MTLRFERGTQPAALRRNPGERVDAGGAVNALRAGEIGAEFQPRIELATGRLSGVEALARWLGPGAAGPAAFVPVLEQAGLGAELTARILDVACAALDQWRLAGVSPCVTLNVSAAALAEADFAETLAARARAHGFGPDLFTIELVDVDTPAPAVAPVLTRLRRNGFRLATSLSHLGRFTFTELRLDRSVVQDCDRAPHKQQLVKSSITLARQVRARTVAEGIETAAEWDFLRAVGCEHGQGFYVAPAMAAAALPGWLDLWRAAFRSRGA